MVPFGRQTVQGVVLALLDQPEVAETKPITELLAPDTLLVRQQLDLAQWLAEHFYTPLGACIQLMIPTGLSRRADICLSLQADLPPDLSAFSQTQQRLLKLLKSRGNLRGAQIDRAIPKADWRRGLESLRSQALIKTSNVLPPPRIAPKTLRTAALFDAAFQCALTRKRDPGQNLGHTEKAGQSAQIAGPSGISTRFLLDLR